MSLSTLNGTFASFALTDVLKLVGVSGETGLLRVESPALTGRVFFVDGAIVYATTRSGDDLIDDLARLERITDEERDAIERRAVSLEDVRDTRKEVLDVFFRHQVSEVLVRLLSMPDGEFSFAHGVMMTHPVGFRFEVGAALAVASDRMAEWDEIGRFIPSVETTFRMADKIDGPVTVSVTDRIAGAVGSACDAAAGSKRAGTRSVPQDLRIRGGETALRPGCRRVDRRRQNRCRRVGDRGNARLAGRDAQA